MNVRAIILTCIDLVALPQLTRKDLGMVSLYLLRSELRSWMRLTSYVTFSFSLLDSPGEGDSRLRWPRAQWWSSRADG